ncbi:MAG TPA: phage virion morphogenesis protein [Pseudomonas sp.]|uniref:phage virion morphogenesis protein n=1 Tax=Pseudomonas sp. TaxID=306 RepID=UPI002BEECF21|nr:phage virion morphogenesis protein [Pseudomonas sp.]HWH86353.1 phage virion morphogenesis protein [Pseudomonas sp.]
MPSIQLDGGFDPVERLFAQLKAFARHPKKLMEELAYQGEASTRRRFETETDPDGDKWQKSLRAELFGGKTLTKDGHLADSISSDATDEVAVWGSNRIYAAIHQFGGAIHAKTSKGLAFTLADGLNVVVDTVVMPQRAFLGLSNEDREDMLDITEKFIDDLLAEARGVQGGA